MMVTAKTSKRGQLGQPFRQFSEVQGQLSKLRNHVDAIMGGHLSVAEMHELPDVAGGLIGTGS